MNQIEIVSTFVPYMVNIGNHEYDFLPLRQANNPDNTAVSAKITNTTDPAGYHQWRPSWADYGLDSHGECGVPPWHRFAVPSKSAGAGVFWYSFEVNNIHVMIFSSEHNFTEGSPQRIWMESDLASVDRTKTPWVLVSAHRPFYDCQIANNASLPGFPEVNRTDPTGLFAKATYIISLSLQQHLEDMFNKYKVNAYLSGHFHAYVRTCPVFKTNTVNNTMPVCTPYNAPTGIVSITAGVGGAFLQDRTDEHTIFPWIAKYYQKGSHVLGFMRAEANATHLHFQLVLNPITGKKNRRPPGEIADDFTIAQRADLNA